MANFRRLAISKAGVAGNLHLRKCTPLAKFRWAVLSIYPLHTEQPRRDHCPFPRPTAHQRTRPRVTAGIALGFLVTYAVRPHYTDARCKTAAGRPAHFSRLPMRGMTTQASENPSIGHPDDVSRFSP
jgi:hypothetical protein